MKKKQILFITIISIIILLFFIMSNTGYREILENSALLKEKLASLGNWGPVIIVFTIALAIIMSPIPSAPIALAAGALYGHYWGAIYVLTGSVIGATTAFLIARLLGFSFLKRWIESKQMNKWIGSQNTLMGIVFFSRLIPFISFDFISYAAGLTALNFWRFLIATIAGIAPASYLLAHFGNELTSNDSQRVGLVLLALGVVMAVPFVLRVFKSVKAKKKTD